MTRVAKLLEQVDDGEEELTLEALLDELDDDELARLAASDSDDPDEDDEIVIGEASSRVIKRAKAAGRLIRTKAKSKDFHRQVKTKVRTAAKSAAKNGAKSATRAALKVFF
jgi:hypothetical protein